MHTVKTIKSIKEISDDNQEPGLFLIDDGEEESQTSTAADIAFLLAVDNRVPTVFFSLEKKEDDIVREHLRILLSRYTDNIPGLATAPQEEWDKAIKGIVTLSKAPLFIDDSPDLLSIDEMHTLAKIIISEQKVRVFIMDGIHLLEEENPINQLEEMAADLNVTIIALQKHNTQ